MAARPIGRFYELQQEVDVPEPYVLTSKIKIPPPTRKQMVAFRAATNEADMERALFGDRYDDIAELFGDRPEQEYTAFANEVWKHFFGRGINDVEGKSGESSTS
ncbi:hypothetical protein AB0H71_13685 [Nocardia sp. NPDC050697]|uniref:hypothetical protein n=1 Tax=Nocardia sp. NPDC050697 TaxID=3155158 RepID=UPI0033F2BFA8